MGLVYYYDLPCQRPRPCARFAHLIQHLNARGRMGDMDDGPDQHPLPDIDVQSAICALLPKNNFDIILTHGPCGEYTRHLRHEEVCRAVIDLWRQNLIVTKSLSLFAYEDGGKTYLPKANSAAPVQTSLSEKTWEEKYRIITEIYGFSPDSFEARTTPRLEAFWTFSDPKICCEWMKRGKKSV